MIKTTKRKQEVIKFMNKIASKREKWIKRNRYYYKDLIKFLKYNIPEESKVIEIGSGTGYILNSLNPKIGFGIDISKEMIDVGKSKYKNLKFLQMDAENIEIKEKFDYIIISDTIGYFEDVQKVFYQLHKISHPGTRIIITYQNFLWLPIFFIAELLRLKMPSKRLNWLNLEDISNLLELSGFDTIKTGRRFLFPKFFPFISWFYNKYLAFLPLFNKLCLTEYIIAKQHVSLPINNSEYSVSVIIPAMNEKGNIENAIKRMPKLGKHTEIIFVEGNSTDDTLKEIKRNVKKYSKRLL